MRGRNIHKLPRKGVENFQKSPSEPCYIFFLTFHFLSWQHEVCHLEPQEHNFTLLLMRFFLSIFTQSSWCGFARKYENVFIPPISSICIINRALFLCVSAFKIFCFNAKLLRTIKVGKQVSMFSQAWAMLQGPSFPLTQGGCEKQGASKFWQYQDVEKHAFQYQ